MAWTAPRTWTATEFVTAALMNTHIRDNELVLKIAIDDAGNISFNSISSLTLSGDACTPTTNFHTVDTEGGASTDNLSTLTVAGSIRSGHVLVLTATNVARVVTVKNGTGNIVMAKGDFALSAASKFLVLLLQGATWYELTRSDMAGALMGPQLQNYDETKVAVASAASVTFDLSLANHFAVNPLNTNIGTIAFSNLHASGRAQSWFIYFTGDGTQRTLTWPAAVKWAYGAAPTPTATNGKTDIYLFVTHDGGTTVYASVVGQNY